MKTHRFHPWRRMRDLGPTWRLRWTDALPDDMFGFTSHATKTIVMRNGMTFEERRCTITHEVEHAIRGPVSVCRNLPEEVVVERRSSQLLLTSIRDLADSLVFHHGEYERVAADLWVDPLTLETRLGSLLPDEESYLRDRLADVRL